MGIKPFEKKDGTLALRVTCEDRLANVSPLPNVQAQFPADQRIEAEGFFIFRGTRKHRHEFALLTFAGIANGFLRQKRHLKLGEATVVAYGEDLKPALLRFGQKIIGEVTPQDLRHLHDWACRQKWAEYKVNALTQRVNQVLKFARSQKAIVVNPMDEAKTSFTDYRPGKVIISVPTLPEMEKLYAAAEPIEQLVLCLAADLGLSPTEIDKQLLANCDPNRAMMFVPHTEYEGDDPNNPFGRQLQMTERVMLAMLLVQSEMRQAGKSSEKLVPAGTAKQILRRLQLRSNLLSPESEKAVAIAKAEAKANGVVYGKRNGTDEADDADEQRLETRYDADDFTHVAALRYIAQGKRTKQLSILMNLTIPIVTKRYGYELEMAHGPSTIEATRKASNLVLDKILKLGLVAPQAAQVPTNAEITG